MIWKMLKKDKSTGQSTIEYILLLVVVIAIALTTFTRVKDSLVRSDNSFIKTLFKGLESSVSTAQSGGKFKKFKFKKQE